jgi:hypothetical protein
MRHRAEFPLHVRPAMTSSQQLGLIILLLSFAVYVIVRVH